MARLTKRDAEALLASFDVDPTGALRRALAKVLDRPNATWRELLDIAPLHDHERASLLAGDTAAHDRLARELNEQRSLAPRTPHGGAGRVARGTCRDA